MQNESDDDFSDDGMNQWPSAGREYFCYVMGPIDTWQGWRAPPTGAYSDLIPKLEDAIGELGWNGGHDRWHDGRWRVAPLPEPDICGQLAVFATKIDNNGTTFICSPHPLPWLERGDVSERRVHLQLGTIAVEKLPVGLRG
jgi:hypothetical protein